MKQFWQDNYPRIIFSIIGVAAMLFLFNWPDNSDNYSAPTQAETLQEMQATYDNIVELSDEINDIVAQTPEGTQTTSEAMVVTLLTAQETLDRCVDEAKTYGYILDDYTYDASLEEQDELYALLAENDLPLGTDGVRAKCLQFTYPN